MQVGFHVFGMGNSTTKQKEILPTLPMGYAPAFARGGINRITACLSLTDLSWTLQNLSLWKLFQIHPRAVAAKIGDECDGQCNV